ncbi:polysaccharide export protein EpsE [Sideroxydans sp. CL21]|uniref:polysaccharide export protein EpsE n=1 Tax=Sideroxydans sp. CL21 TaxID=2600596 RepID=UPI0024BC5BD0|nr:polysaccharide export protein EpsE [Sideroxydans sp. CL21]
MLGKGIIRLLLLLLLVMNGVSGQAAEGNNDYRLGAGDTMHIVVFQNPDLTTEVRVSESGEISYPLLGSVELGGMTITAAEKKIASLLKDGKFVQQPQVNIVLTQVRGNQVSVLGQVNRPGRYPLETFTIHVSDILAVAGGATGTGSDNVILTGTRNGKLFRKEIDIPSLFLDDKRSDDVLVEGGDIIYVHRAPMYYIYGEVQRPGSYRVERNMTLMQALAQGGGPTLRGTQRNIKIFRRGGSGKLDEISLDLTAPVNNDDVLYVRESLF